MPRSWLDGKVAVAGIGHTAYGRRGEFAERGTFALACEAVVRACEDAGIDPRTYLEILTSTLFTAPVYKTYGDLIVGEKYDQVGFGAALGLKDIRLALAAAEAHRSPLPLASLVRDHLLAVLAQGGDAQDWSALGRLAAKNAGL